MKRKYFGTDGVRGHVGEEPITPDFVMRLGYAAGRVLAELNRDLASGERPEVVIGKDTRVSGYMLESALEAGLSAAGVDVALLGPMPTPAVAHIIRALRAQAGIVVSASHNPYADNGIKFFGANGMKLADKVEEAIEAHLDKPMKTLASEHLGKARRINDAPGRYVEFCKSSFPNELDLRGLRLVVDCAHGAAYQVGPLVFHELGAEVISIGIEPNGLNINDKCGSTHPEALQRKVAETRADLGIALDGDGDRVVMVTGSGEVVDGDQLLYAIANDRLREGSLKGGVVGTLMTNLALEKALADAGVPFLRARVGDRYVLEMLLAEGWQIGGENSGHILCLDKHTSGDGIISALQVLKAMLHRGVGLADLAAELPLFPQVMVNVGAPRGFAVGDLPSVREAVAAAEKGLNGHGRVLLRSSGTEPVVRVMVECDDAALAGRWAESLAAVVEDAVGGAIG